MSALNNRPIQIYLQTRQLEALRVLAKQRKTSVAELVRQGVDKLLADTPPEEDPLWTIVGTARSGLGDLAEKHDEYLAGWERERNRSGGG